jgi:hypothetical protein
MKTTLRTCCLLPLVVLLLASCNNETETTTTSTDTTSTTEEALGTAGEISTKSIDSLCYLMVSGATMQDTKSLKIIVKGNDVTGVLMYLPHQKDARFGRIAGTKKGDIIDAQWHYEQEGMKDKVAVSFKLNEKGILQKSSSFNMKNGREYLDDSASYDLQYEPTDCSNLPQYNIDF